MSNASSWMDFAQRSRDAGGLGLAPHQASGLVGNLVNESGPDLNPWGPTGDNGTAWGTAQWRGDRLANLKAHAQANGLDYRTPEAQQAFMRHEFDTSENPAYQALQAATTPEEAATAVNTRYERSADRSGNRERSARSLYTDGPTAIDQAMGRTRPTSQRAGAGQAMGYAATPDDEETTPALSSAPPPGPLTQGPSKGNWLSTLGDTLMAAAPGIASISDADRAKALATIYAASQKTADNGKWSTGSVDAKTGTAVQTNDKTGQTRILKVHAPQPELTPGETEQQKAEAKASTDRFNTLQDGVGGADEQLRTIGMLRKAVQNPDVTFGGLGDTAASAKNLAYSLGIPTDGLSDTQVVQRLATKMQLSQGKLLPGAISNYEDKLLSQANGVGVDKSREANLAALDAQEAIYKHQKAYAAEALKYKQEHGSLDDGWFAHSNQWIANNQPQYAAPAAPAAPANRPPLRDIFK